MLFLNLDLDRDFFAHFLLVFFACFFHDFFSNFVLVFGSCTFFCRVLLPERSSPERRAEDTGEEGEEDTEEALAYIAEEEEEVAGEEFTRASERRKEKP